MMKKEADTEIWGPFVNKPDFFNIGNLIVTNSNYDQDFRITCDFVEDYKFILKIYELMPNEPYPDLSHIYDLFLKFNELLKINNMHIQRSVSPDLMKEIQQQFEQNRKKGLKFAEQNNILLQPGLVNFYLKLFEPDIHAIEKERN